MAGRAPSADQRPSRPRPDADPARLPEELSLDLELDRMTLTAVSDVYYELEGGSQWVKKETVLDPLLPSWWDQPRVTSSNTGHGIYDAARKRVVTNVTTNAGGFWELSRDSYPNHAPALLVTGDDGSVVGDRVQVFAGDPLRLQLAGKDADGQSVTYECFNLPDGATLDPQSGELRWTPFPAQAGTHVLDVYAHDGGACASTTLTIEVRQDHHPLLPAGTVAFDASMQRVEVLYGDAYCVDLGCTVKGLHTYRTTGNLAVVLSGQNPGKVAVAVGLSVDLKVEPGSAPTWSTSASGVLDPDETFAIKHRGSGSEVTITGHIETDAHGDLPTSTLGRSCDASRSWTKIGTTATTSCLFPNALYCFED